MKNINKNIINYGWNLTTPPSCNYIAPQIIKIIKKLGITKVLDVGSGNGYLSGLLSKNGLYVVGIEKDKEGYQISKNKYPQIKFYNFSIEDDVSLLMNHEEPFDAIVSTEVIEHLFQPDLLLNYSSGALKKNGYLILSTPYHGYIKNLLISLFDKWDDHHTALWNGGHIKFWSKKTITKLLEDNGYEFIEFIGVGRMRYLWKSMIIIAKKNIN